MPRQGNKDEIPSSQYLEVPMIVYSAGRRVRVGVASVFADGIAAHFDETPDDDFAKSVIKAITSGLINALSIAPTPEKDPTLADYVKERE